MKLPPFSFPISSLTSSINESTSNPQTITNPDNENTHNDVGDDDDDGEKTEEDDGCLRVHSGSKDESLYQNVGVIMDILKEQRSNCSLLKELLENCGVAPTSELVVEVLSRVRNDWEVAFTFFLWASKQSNYKHSVREYHSMISILGKMRKFDTAWALIDEMRGGKTGPNLVTKQTLLIMIRRYCAVHDVGRAINAFYAHKKFKFEVGVEDFQNFISALCRYKNVKDAEHLLFCNKDVFALNTKSFNIILNGWCNVVGNSREGRRIWKEMNERRIPRDAVSYACLISCYSKSKRMNEVLKLFDQMKTLDIVPDRKVYNAVIHTLAKGRLVREAQNLMKTMEEKGIHPNAVTYNSLIMPLCKTRQLDEAQEVFHQMLERGLIPTVRTYHAFFRILRTGEDVFALLQKMNIMGCHPSHDTYIMLIRKFCRWRQLDNVFKLWDQMRENGLDPDRSSYIVMIHGLFLNGMLDEAYRYYLEMKEKDLLPEPKIEEMLQTWLSGKQDAVSKENGADFSQPGKTKVRSKDFDLERDLRMKPETRRVVRERGYSFWEK